MEEESNGVSKNKNDRTKLFSNQGQDKTQPTNFLDRFSQPEKQVTHHNKQTQNSISSSSSTSSNPPQVPDLNLGLSVGGGGSSSSSETSKGNPLTRSLSIGGIITVRTNNSDENPFFGRTYNCNLPRACSLPGGAEQVQRVTTMREMHSMRRIHAKNSFIAKRQRTNREAKEKERHKPQQPDPPKPTVPSEVAAWAAASAANSPALCRALLKIKTEGLIPAKRGRSRGQSKPTASGSFKVPPVPKNAELIITAATSNGVSVNQAEPKSENPLKKSRACCGGFESNGMDVMRQMPSVRATGDGPSGRRVEGFLCSYMRGQVSIVCTCHGSFLSPAEFIKHAGGRDVPNPMKHITVYSTFAA